MTRHASMSDDKCHRKEKKKSKKGQECQSIGLEAEEFAALNRIVRVGLMEQVRLDQT